MSDGKPRYRKTKFDECEECTHLGTWRCARCTVGEYFEEREENLGVYEDLENNYDE